MKDFCNALAAFYGQPLHSVETITALTANCAGLLLLVNVSQKPIVKVTVNRAADGHVKSPRTPGAFY
jgi:hypothetical protein